MSHNGPPQSSRYICLLLLAWVCRGCADNMSRPNRTYVEAWLYGNILKYAYYYTELLVGTPVPQRTSVIVDTGSHLVGFPCKGCKHCGEHKDPAFDITNSSTAQWLSCKSSQCDECPDGECRYKAAYSEGSAVSGRWFKDIVHFEGPHGLGDALHARLGCHAQESNLFFTQRADGIMGLAPAASSRGLMPHKTILHDLFQDEAHVNASIFSLCFSTWGGRLLIGGHEPNYREAPLRQGPASWQGSQGAAGLETGTIQWIPMTPNLYYLVFPTGLVLDGLLMGIGRGAFGPTIVDSGTTFSLFPGALFMNLYNGLHTHCSVHGCGARKDSTGKCWVLENMLQGPKHFPMLRLQFGQEEIDWPPHAYLHQSEKGPDIWCLSFEQSEGVTTVLGISWMLHKDIIFDIDSHRLGIVHTVCPERGRPDSLFLQEFSNPQLTSAAPKAGTVWGRFYPIAFVTIAAPLCAVIGAAASICLRARGAAVRQLLPCSRRVQDLRVHALD